jgi:multiple sugar transport system ATP-binding protein
VALGRAIVRDPKCFLMDEPLGALDAEFRERMSEELRALHDRMGATTVYVTHDQLEAMQMGDKIVVMNHGVVEQFGTPQDIYDWPATMFVAELHRLAADELPALRRHGRSGGAACHNARPDARSPPARAL